MQEKRDTQHTTCVRAVDEYGKDKVGRAESLRCAHA